MSDVEKRREWTPDAAYADALAELQSVLDRNFPLGDEWYADPDADDSAGRHSAPNPAGAKPLRSVGAVEHRRGEHTHEAVREPLVNGTRASDLFVLLQRHGALDLPSLERPDAAEDAAPSPKEEAVPVDPAAPRSADPTPIEQAVESPTRESVTPAQHEMGRADPPPRVPGRRSGFIPLPEPEAAHRERIGVRERIAKWYEALVGDAEKTNARAKPVRHR